MGGSCDHPSLVRVKYQIRSYLLVKQSDLIGENYNIIEFMENRLPGNLLAHE